MSVPQKRIPSTVVSLYPFLRNRCYLFKRNLFLNTMCSWITHVNKASDYVNDYKACYDLKDSARTYLQHCCRLQAVYSTITVKNFVTVYTAFKPCNRDQRTISSIKPNPMWQVQNPHWKSVQQTPSVGTLCIFKDYGLNYIFLGIKLFLFFKVESWNFQHLFEKKIVKPHKI